MLKLKANERVLDVGCGIGGGDFLMAEKYDVYVHGVDLSVNMVLIALDRASQAKKSKVGSCLCWLKSDYTTELSDGPSKFDQVSDREMVGSATAKAVKYLLMMQVSFEIADIMTCDLRPDFFDVIYSRDTILHIKDKPSLFRR